MASAPRISPPGRRLGATRDAFALASLAARRKREATSDPAPPAGYRLLRAASGALLLTANGRYLLTKEI